MTVHSLLGVGDFRRWLVVMALFTLFAVVAAPATSAHAEDSLGCANSSICGWWNANYEGSQWTRTLSAENENTWRYVGETFNDEISSLDNHRAHITWVSQSYPQDGLDLCMASEARWPNLTTHRWGGGNSANDSMSSFFMSSESSCI